MTKTKKISFISISYLILFFSFTRIITNVIYDMPGFGILFLLVSVVTFLFLSKYTLNSILSYFLGVDYSAERKKDNDFSKYLYDLKVKETKEKSLDEKQKERHLKLLQSNENMFSQKSEEIESAPSDIKKMCLVNRNEEIDFYLSQYETNISNILNNYYPGITWSWSQMNAKTLFESLIKEKKGFIIVSYQNKLIKTEIKVSSKFNILFFSFENTLKNIDLVTKKASKRNKKTSVSKVQSKPENSAIAEEVIDLSELSDFPHEECVIADISRELELLPDFIKEEYEQCYISDEIIKPEKQKKNIKPSSNVLNPVSKEDNIIIKNGKPELKPNYNFIAKQWVTDNYDYINKVCNDVFAKNNSIGDIRALLIKSKLPEKETWDFIGNICIENQDIDEYLIQKDGILIVIKK